MEGGTFQIGDTFGDGGADEKPVHSVTVSSFRIAKYEVTYRYNSGPGYSRNGSGFRPVRRPG